MKKIKIFVSKTQLKKYKIYSDTINTWERFYHAGYIEEPEYVANYIMDFLDECKIFYTYKIINN